MLYTILPLCENAGRHKALKDSACRPLYSEGVMSNDWITASLNAVGSGALELSEGSVYSFRRKLAEASGESIRYLHKNRIEKKPEMDDQWK